jgi:hypothetical protein
MRELAAPDGVGRGTDPGRELGVGGVYFAIDDGGVPPMPADTIRVFADTASGAPVALLVRFGDGASWRYATYARGDDRPTWVEFGYEVAGVPIERVAPDGAWVQVIHAVAPTGATRSGWVRLDSARVRTRFWADVLPELASHFIGSAPGPFHEAPDGPRVGLPWTATEWSYILHPDSVAGDWMRVRVVSPIDTCGAEEQSGDRRREAHAWIRWRDTRGRPLVWYHTRGC